MEETRVTADLSELKSLSSDFCKLGDDYIFSHITTSAAGINRQADYNTPVRVSGLTIFFIFDGIVTIDINTTHYQLQPMTLLALPRSSIVKIVEIESEQIDAYYLYLSSQFLRDINIDLNVFNISLIDKDPSPVIDSLSDIEAKQLSSYMYLMYLNAESNGETIYSKNVGRSLTQALIYQMMQIKFDHSHQFEYQDKPASRQLSYVKEFMRLAQQHHAKERSLTFYADHLYISPKYLSRIIKNATGRSAAEWIDQFVLIDAKNMLRFSSKNVQQVAYALNFSTQSSFGKFFKHLTGMSPSEYQQT